MPQLNPTVPLNPARLRGTFAKPPTSRAYGRHGVSGPLPPPPRPRVRGRTAGDGPDEAGEKDEAYQEAVEKQEQEDAKEEAEQGKHQGEIVGEVEEVATAPGPPSEGGPLRKRRSKGHPQKSISKLWKNFDPEYLGRVTRILPETTAGASSVAASQAHYSQNAAESYREARAACEDRVRKIVKECTAMNQKYTDVHFDLESDLKITRKRNCIDGLVQDESDRDDPSDVKRVTVCDTARNHRLVLTSNRISSITQNSSPMVLDSTTSFKVP